MTCSAAGGRWSWHTQRRGAFNASFGVLYHPHDGCTPPTGAAQAVCRAGRQLKLQRREEQPCAGVVDTTGGRGFVLSVESNYYGQGA